MALTTLFTGWESPKPTGTNESQQQRRQRAAKEFVRQSRARIIGIERRGLVIEIAKVNDDLFFQQVLADLEISQYRLVYLSEPR